MRSTNPEPRVWHIMQRSAFNKDGSLWFPTRLTQQWLDDQKATLGPYLFSSQYLNEPIAAENRRFQPEWIVYRDCYLEYAEGHVSLITGDVGKLYPCNVFTTVDPAISERRYADYTGIITVGVTVTNDWFVLSARRIRGSAHIILDEIIREIRTWRTGILGIETVAYQKALKEFLLDRLQKENLLVGIEELKSGSGRSKRTRIEGLVPLFSQNRIFLRKGISQDLEFELLTWSPDQDSGHDDLIDALSHQLGMAFPASAEGQRVLGADWFDLPPEERRKIKARKEQVEQGVGELTTGYGDTSHKPQEKDWRSDIYGA